MRRFFKLATASFILCSMLNLNQARAQVNVTDSLALVALYNATDGPNWTNNTNWLTGTADTWFGITVTGNRVTNIVFNGNNLVGIIPVDLGNLTNLTGLTLNNNLLIGGIPSELGNLTSLTALALHVNQLTGNVPPELGSLNNLVDLTLNDNQLTGTIPVVLGNLTNLEVLWLSDNQLTGSIPVELGNLGNLFWLWLSDNQLSGTIPAELGNLTNLLDLAIRNNLLTGSIPIELGNLINLTSLTLNNNLLTGSIPLELGNLGNLSLLWISGNQLSGTIPVEVGDLTNLANLALSNNLLTGSIPIELGNLANLTDLGLVSNQLSGTIPAELGNMLNLTSLSLDANQLNGPIPVELGNLTNLTYLSLNSNQLSGSIPVELGNLVNLTFLNLTTNLLSGTIPVELGNLINLSSLSLNSNELSGSIPVELGNLANLTLLYLSNNQLTGNIPIELGNLANLTSLVLSDNQLTGNIPIELANLTNLQMLWLSRNEFIDLPDISGLSLLTDFRVRYNNFSFEDLEPNITLFLDSTYYSPQNLIGIADTLLLNPGDTISLSIPVGGSANQYQWQKDGLDISGATSDFLNLSNVDTTDNGLYKLLISSSLVASLILESAEIIVNIAGTTPSDFYWVGDGGVWTDLTHWSSTSGGVPDKITLPGKYDDVFFDANSFTTPTQVVAILDDDSLSLEGETWKNMDWTGITNSPTFQIRISTAPYLFNWVYGSLIFDPNMNLDFDGAEFYFVGDEDYVIDTKGLYLGDLCWLYINGPEPDGGGVSDVVCNVLSDINPAGFYLNKGTLNFNGHNLYEKDSYVWIAGDSSTLDITGSIVDISTFYLSSTWVGATLIDDNATVTVSTLLRTSGINFNHVVLTDSAQVLQYSNSFDTLEIAPGASITFESEVTQNVGELILQGTSLLPITISATKLDTAAIISKLTGRVDASHVFFQDNAAVGGAVFNAYSSIDLGNTTGWNFRNNSAQDSLALLTLYNATGGPSWVNSTNWNTAEPLSTWYGVTVNDSSRVSGIRLRFNNLNGTVPPEIGDLTELEYLALGRNFGLTGTIPPEIGQLQKLDTLSFSYSGLTGSIPDELYNLSNLIRFSMSNSQITGTLSPRISNLTNLKHIALWNTPLSGDIPVEFWDMTQLERIYLGTNAQGGEISPKIGEFTNLDEFWISGSKLTGIIPPEIGNASSSTLINLYNNNLYGPVPNEINNLTNLKRFEIQSNNLDFLPEIVGLDSLQIFKISDNKFTYGDILPNQGLITDNTSQKPFGDSVQVQAYTFEGLRLDPGLEFVDGQQYQWYKENVALPDGTGHYYFIDDFREGDGGVYYLTVTHPDVDSLTLTRNPMVVTENKGDPPKPQAVEVISPNGDGINDEMTIKNIELYPQHRVLIYDVLGRLVYFTTQYDNINNPFIGIGNQNGFKELPSGTYYYLIDVGDTKKNGTGFFVMKKR